MYTPKANPLPNISSKYFNMYTVRRITSTTINVNKNGPIKDPKISLSNFFMKCYRPAFLLTYQFYKGCNINCKIFYISGFYPPMISFNDPIRPSQIDSCSSSL